MAIKKSRILFLGGFSVGRDGTEGGQVFACRSLVASPLSNYVEWKLVDSTQRSLPPPGILIRAWDALRRLLQCCSHLMFSRIDSVLVFTNFSWLSLLEKGLVCIVAGCLGKHAVVSFRFHPSLPRRFTALYRVYFRLICHCCSKLVCQSQLAADELVRLFQVDSGKIEVVHNWIDVTRFAADHSSPHRRTDTNVRLIYVGWMHPKKGVQFLIPAIKLLSEIRQNFQLTMCGGGDLYDSLVQQTTALGIQHFIDFRGWVKNEEVNRLLNAADVFVLPSLAEGMPNSLLQAMACGLPVVTTNVSSIPAIVTDRVNGILIEPASPAQICEGLRVLIDSPELRDQMSHTNRQQITANHDISTAWKKMAKILNVVTHSNENLVLPNTGTEETDQQAAAKQD
ncbi:MAG: glycosyltransferase family 4 protein [Planctomycetaceae bacterium]